MGEDQVERDRLLTEVHTNVGHLLEGFQAHLTDDKEQFAAIRKSLSILFKSLWTCLGAGAVILYFFQLYANAAK